MGMPSDFWFYMFNHVEMKFNHIRKQNMIQQFTSRKMLPTIFIFISCVDGITWPGLSGWGREENLAFLSRRYRQQPEHSLFGETQELGKTHDLQPSQPSGCKASICAFGEGQGDRGIGPWWNVGSGAGGGAGWPQRPTSSPELCVSNWGLLSSHHWGQRERKLADHMP